MKSTYMYWFAAMV